MANELRLRQNVVFGTLSAAVDAVAIALSSAGFDSLLAVSSAEHMAVTLDPEERDGPAEIVWVTAHTAAATDVTVARGQEGTTGRPHGAGTTWAHCPTVRDFEQRYVHAQPTPAAVWTINHNLGFQPNVQVVDSGGTVLIGDVDHVSAQTLTVTFSAGFAGTAYVS